MGDYGRPHTPGTPGTPATFDSMPTGQFQDNAGFASQYDPHNRALSPSPMKWNESAGQGTYYFEKNGGAARNAGSALLPGAGADAMASKRKTGFFAWIKRHPVWTALIAIIIVAAAVGGGVGGALGASSSSKTNNLADQNGKTNGQSGSNNSGGSSSGSGSGSGSTAQKPIVPLAKWNMTDPESRMVGVSLGNWLVLERWIDEDWFTQTAGDNTWDEWSFTKSLGTAKAKTALLDHWNSWVQESDFDTLQSVGINTVRIPVGYWAFVPAASGEPYIAQSGQTDQIQKVLGWLYNRGMYAMIDLHGMPGSQNGDQSSGHNTSNSAWWDSDNFGYGYDVLNATIQFIQQSNYSSVVHSVCPVNEPHAYQDSGKLSQLTSYYESAYNQLKNAGLIMMFHHGFVSSPYNYWSTFATGKDPNYLAMNDNPYPGWFPPNSDQSDMVSKVCTLAQKASQFPVPVVMTEYSAVNNAGSSSFTTEYYNTQVSAYAWSGGSMFWTFKTEHSSTQVLAPANNIIDLYSLTTLASNGVVQKVESGAKPLEVIKSLPNQECGSIPTVTWSNPSGDTESS
jgi:aryl-phospho-beta-D-glucosidase BglC (GH1 family)